MLGELAVSIRVDSDELGESLKALRDHLTLLQIQVGADESITDSVKSTLVSNLSRIWVAFDAITVKFIGDGEKKEGIAGDISGVISTTLAHVAQTKLDV